MKYFSCPHCNKQLINLTHFPVAGAPENNFWCDDCNKEYIVENNGDYKEIEE